MLQVLGLNSEQTLNKLKPRELKKIKPRERKLRPREFHLRVLIKIKQKTNKTKQTVITKQNKTKQEQKTNCLYFRFRSRKSMINTLPNLLVFTYFPTL